MNMVGHATLLTDEGRQARLDTLLAGRFRQRGKLHLPTTVQYDALATNEGLLQTAKDMCRWLGVKPSGLQVRYTKQTSAVTYADHILSINEQYRLHPYAVGTLLALGTVEYFLSRYDTAQAADRGFIEYTTLHTGLGLWVLNGSSPKTSQPEKLYHAFDGRWFHNEGISLLAYTPAQYGSEVAQYAHANRIAPQTYVPHVSPRSRHILPNLVLADTARSLTEPHIVYMHKKQARLLWIKLMLIIMTFALATTVAAYSLAQHSPTTDPIQIQAADNLTLTKKSLDECVGKAMQQQDTYDPNDIFMTRQIDATKAQCESLRNQYNHAVSDYRDKYGH